MVKDLETKFEFPIAGSLRIGEKNERNIPKKLEYFTVHEDSHTTKDIVDLFNSKFKNPKELVIKFLSDNPMEDDYIRYGKSGLQCKGDGEIAIYNDKTEWKEYECSKDCKYRGKECKRTGRLYFIIKGIDIGGVWRLQTQGINAIENFELTLNFLKSMGIDIKEKEFRLAAEERKTVVDGKVNKYTTMSLKMLVSSEERKNITNGTRKEKISNKEELKTETKKEIKIETETKPKEIETKVEPKKEDIKVINDTLKTVNEKSQEISNINSSKEAEDNFEKCLTLFGVNDIAKGEKTAKQATFYNMNDEEITVLLHPDIIEEVETWEMSSVIIPTNIYEQNGYKILKEYKEVQITKKQC